MVRMSESALQSTSYYRWEGDACRVHEDEHGNLTADIYRSGRGIFPVNATDVLYGSVEISEKQYKELVQQKIAFRQKIGSE